VPELTFEVLSAAPVLFGAAPAIALRVRVDNRTDEPVQGMLLRCQVRMEPAGRRYGPDEQERLRDLFGPPERWSQTVRSLLWTQASVVGSAFRHRDTVEIALPCGFDFNATAAKLFYALDDGEMPLSLLFSGTVFVTGSDGGLQVAQVPWSAEARFRLPVRVWRETLDHYYPGTAVLPLRRDVFDRLYRYKTRHGLPTWEQAVESLLELEPDRVP
jgi:hypothetical protein